jgi:hypothetical protein
MHTPSVGALRQPLPDCAIAAQGRVRHRVGDGSVVAGAGKGTIRVARFPFVLIAGLAIHRGETGIGDPQRAKKRWSDEGIRDVFR